MPFIRSVEPGVGKDERVLRELMKFQQMKPGQVKLVGVACGEEQAKACGCETPYPAEITAGEKTAGVDSDATLAEIEKLPPAQRLTYWLESFDRCIKCYGCKSICPMCFCADCNLQNKTLVPAAGILPVGALKDELKIQAMYVDALPKGSRTRVRFPLTMRNRGMALS
jgi:ferredoxin